MYMDCEAIAQMLGLNAAHVRDRLTRHRGFPAGFRIGGVLRWRKDEIEEWIEAQRVNRGARRSARQTRGSTRSPAPSRPDDR